MKPGAPRYYGVLLATGLAAAQVFAFFHVLASNRVLYARLHALHEAGYVIVPNANLLPALLRPAMAFNAGLFFTLSLGVLLTLSALAGVGLWHLAGRRRWVPAMLALAWLAALVAVNSDGPVPWASGYVIIVPGAVTAAALRLRPHARQGARAPSRRFAAAAAAFAATAAVIYFSADLRMFVNIRDYALLSNPLGRTVSDFYYTYSLSAAETFKTPRQKLIRAYHPPADGTGRGAARLQRVLLRHDYLPLDSGVPAELTCRLEDGELHLLSGGTVILTTTVHEMQGQTSRLLGEFSEKADRCSFFRRMTFLGVLLATALAGFLLLYLPLRLLCALLPVPALRTWGAAVLCLACVAVLMFLMRDYTGRQVTRGNLEAYLASGQFWDRLAALRYMDANGIAAAEYPGARHLLHSPLSAERYWLAKVLGHSRRDQAFQDLTALSADSHPNVRCMAFRSLGRMGRAQAVPHVLEYLETSHHWYSQWYAYKALRRLGWSQAQVKGDAG